MRARSVPPLTKPWSSFHQGNHTVSRLHFESFGRQRGSLPHGTPWIHAYRLESGIHAGLTLAAKNPATPGAGVNKRQNDDHSPQLQSDLGSSLYHVALAILNGTLDILG
jgi:hypothetical protein